MTIIDRPHGAVHGRTLEAHLHAEPPSNFPLRKCSETFATNPLRMSLVRVLWGLERRNIIRTSLGAACVVLVAYERIRKETTIRNLLSDTAIKNDVHFTKEGGRMSRRLLH